MQKSEKIYNCPGKISCFVFLLIFWLSSPLLKSSWTPLPSPSGGFVHQILYHNNDLYAVTPGAGIFISSNNGDNWTQITKNHPELRSVRYLSGDASYLYAATDSKGIYITSDKGNTWEMVHDSVINGKPFFVNKIIHLNSEIYVSSTEGIIKSIDNGMNWTINNAGLPVNNSLDIIENKETLFLGSPSGLFKSTNGAQSWIPAGFQDITVYKLFKTNNRLYACTFDSVAQSGAFFNIYESSDDGSNWTKYLDNIFQNSQILAFSELNTKLLIKSLKIIDSVGISHIYESNDNGSNWIIIHSDSTRYTNKINSSLSQTPGYILIGTRFEGIRRKSNLEQNWVKANNGLLNIQVASLTYKSSKFYAGTYENGMYSSDLTFDWRLSQNSPLLNEEMYKRINKIIGYGNNLIVGTSEGIFSSTNNGIDWTDLGLNNYDIPDLDSLNGKIYSFGNYKINNLFVKGDLFVSDNQGQTWTIRSIPDNPYISAMLVLNQNIFLGTFSGLIHSSDDGKTWKNLDNKFIDSLTILSITKVKSNFLCATQKGLFLSSDNGLTWTETKIGLKTKHFYKVYSYGLYSFAISDKGVYISKDLGATWEESNEGLNNLDMLEIYGINDSLYVIPLGDGIYRSGLKDSFPISIAEIPFTHFCPEMDFKVTYTVDPKVSFTSDNLFIVQLSDSSGDFNNTIYNIGSIRSNQSGDINARIPKNIPNSNFYRIRIISSNPGLVGCDNLFDLSISKVTPPQISGSLSSCQNKSETYSIPYTNGYSYKWIASNGTIVGDSTSFSVLVNWTGTGQGSLKAFQYNSLQCYDSSQVSIEININPLVPIISKQDSFLVSDADTGIQWYLNNIIIPDAINQKFKPLVSGSYTVSVTNNSGCITYSQPFTFDNSDDFTYLKIDDTEGSPGSLVNIYVRLNKGKDFKNYSINKLTGTLTFDASILYPNDTQKGLTVKNIRYINLDLDTNFITENIITVIPCKVMLGDALRTELKINNLTNDGSQVSIPVRSGHFTLNGVCLEGGPRLISSSGSVVIKSVTPNPATNEIIFNYETIEEGITQIFIINTTGEIVETLYTGHLVPGKHSDNYSLKEINSGEYYIVMSTNSINIMTKLIINR